MNESEEIVLITRYPDLEGFLKEIGVIGKHHKVKVLEYVEPEDITDKHVIGGMKLPYWLKVLMASQTLLSFNIPMHLKNKPLTNEQRKQYFKGASTYELQQVASSRYDYRKDSLV